MGENLDGKIRQRREAIPEISHKHTSSHLRPLYLHTLKITRYIKSDTMESENKGFLFIYVFFIGNKLNQ